MFKRLRDRPVRVWGFRGSDPCAPAPRPPAEWDPTTVPRFARPA